MPKKSARHEHGHTHELVEHDHHHQLGTVDAHLWLLPHNAKVIAQRMSADLSQLDPNNAKQYAANLHAFNQRLRSPRSATASATSAAAQ